MPRRLMQNILTTLRVVEEDKPRKLVLIELGSQAVEMGNQECFADHPQMKAG